MIQNYTYHNCRHNFISSFQATNIKLEIWLFLKNLLEIKKNPNAFDNQTINLIETVQDTIVELLNQFKNKSVNALTSSNNEYELLRDINKDEFQFQRFLVCQMCNVSICLCMY